MIHTDRPSSQPFMKFIAQKSVDSERLFYIHRKIMAEIYTYTVRKQLVLHRFNDDEYNCSSCKSS